MGPTKAENRGKLLDEGKPCKGKKSIPCSFNQKLMDVPRDPSLEIMSLEILAHQAVGHAIIL